MDQTNNQGAPVAPVSPEPSVAQPAANVPQAKNKKPLIIAIIVAVILVIGILLFLIFGAKIFSGGSEGGNGGNSNGGGGNVDVVGSNIVQIDVDSYNVLMLDKNGDLYLFGKIAYAMESTEQPLKIASNVKSFDNTGHLSIIDKDGKASYVGGLNIDGLGTTKEFSSIMDNVKAVSSNTFCFYIIDGDNNYIVRAPLKNENVMKYCALPEGQDGNFSKIANGAKAIFSGSFSNGYVDNNNDLYISGVDATGYQKVLSGIKKIVDGAVLTDDGSLYIISVSGEEVSAKKLVDGVADIYGRTATGNVTYKSNDGKFYYVYADIADADPGKKDLYIYQIPYDDIKTLIYYFNDTKIAYISTNGKIVLNGEGATKQELELDTSSMKAIYEFFKL